MTHQEVSNLQMSNLHPTPNGVPSKAHPYHREYDSGQVVSTSGVCKLSLAPFFGPVGVPCVRCDTNPSLLLGPPQPPKETSGLVSSVKALHLFSIVCRLQTANPPLPPKKNPPRTGGGGGGGQRCRDLRKLLGAGAIGVGLVALFKFTLAGLGGQGPPEESPGKNAGNPSGVAPKHRSAWEGCFKPLLSMVDSPPPGEKRRGKGMGLGVHLGCKKAQAQKDIL